jgi:hypothetical protein
MHSAGMEIPLLYTDTVASVASAHYIALVIG